MTRVTPDDVKTIIDTELTDPRIEVFIKGANLVVNQVFSEDTTTSEDLKTEIERWLTAHMISMGPERSASEEKVGDASVKYSGQFGKYLEATSFGQMVIQLDPTGMMAQYSSKAAVTLFAIESNCD